MNKVIARGMLVSGSIDVNWPARFWYCKNCIRQKISALLNMPPWNIQWK